MNYNVNEVISILKANKEINDKEIRNPYHVNWNIYLWLLGSSALLFVSAVESSGWSANLVEIIKNLSLGCFASTLVALLIEIANVGDKNRKANSLYDAIYVEPHLRVKLFVQCWSEICCVEYKDVEYKTQSHTWLEWYDIYKAEFNLCDEIKKKRVIEYTYKHLKYPVKTVIDSLHTIANQRYFLEVNNLYNGVVGWKIDNLSSEFEAVEAELSHIPKDSEEMFSMLDAIVSDFEKYISNWKDIDYLNYYYHHPYEYEFDLEKYLDALKRSKCKTKEVQSP